MNHKKILFLDADGVLWKDSSVTKWWRFWVSPRKRWTVHKLKKIFENIVVVTNQTYGARNWNSESNFQLFQRIRFSILKIFSGIDSVFFCIHHPNATSPTFRIICDCRKPAPGLILRSLSKLNTGPENCAMIGDRITDIYAAHQAGITNNFLLVNSRMFEIGENPDFQIKTIYPYFRFLDSFEKILDSKYLSKNVDGKSTSILYLGAGIGSRLAPFTKVKPKVLLPIGNETILNRLIRQLMTRESHYRHFVNISHLPYEFGDLFSNLSLSHDISFAWEPNPAGSISTLKNLFNLLGGESDLLVIHGDLVLSEKYVRKLVNIMKAANYPTLISHPREGHLARSHLQADSRGLVSSFSNFPPSIPGNFEVNSGIYFFPREFHGRIHDYLSAGEIADTLLPRLSEHGILYHSSIRELRISVDSVERYREAERLFYQGLF